MGTDIKALRTRIKSVGSTLQLTKAMGLVASSKIRKANSLMEAGRQFASSVQNIVDLLVCCNECKNSPYMQKTEGKTRLICIAGDRGLAGGYNANIFRLVKEYPDAEIYAIGKRACDKFGGENICAEKFDFADAKALSDKMCIDFAKGEFARLGIVCTKYINMMTQQAEVVWVLPLEKPQNIQNKSVVFEPDELMVLNKAVPEYVAAIITACVRESFASEVASRRVAMDSAGKNAQQMIDDLGLEYNRARQGAITQEITEIVAGSGL